MTNKESASRKEFEKEFWKETALPENTSKQNFITAHSMVETEHKMNCLNAPPLTTPCKAYLMDLLWQWIKEEKKKAKGEILKKLKEKTECYSEADNFCGYDAFWSVENEIKKELKQLQDE